MAVLDVKIVDSTTNVINKIENSDLTLISTLLIVMVVIMIANLFIKLYKIHNKSGRAANIELGVHIRDSGHTFAMVQEPYVDSAGRITGFPSGMQVFADKRKKAGIVADSPEAICMPIETSKIVAVDGISRPHGGVLVKVFN